MNLPLLLLAITRLLSCQVVHSFTPPQPSPSLAQRCTSLITPSCEKKAFDSASITSLFMSSEVGVSDAISIGEEDDDDDDETEWVEEEFEVLSERDFYNTEWKIGTLMDNKPRVPSSIDTTWVRLTTTEDGQNKAVWGDNSKGRWVVDVPSQYFSISKETFGGWFGKKIWAGTIEDFYYLEGTVRGWSPVSPASVIGQWQAIRLGVVDGERVTPEERGVAPWFQMVKEGEEDSEEENEGGDN
ncbi:hypothetical protein HJC23_009572 [Cyclotella cryptica]|uniref:Plastid lipid-associated protein/fibrillin conserved domain-containing protein n=1 Tax=Cyclotella cryptica TaxID=29204 RepID=A0ABD3PPR7_9STRA|eukprot:CCRYP_012535-RA/>CCRYP_012535-RA protein AED:0.00 eAED:0.00 QI:230/1/1/1/1/1/2/289/241